MASRISQYSAIVANALIVVGAWFGFYEQVGWAAAMTATLVWVNAGAMLIYLYSDDGARKLASRKPPMAPWLWDLFDVLVGAELLAAQAYATAFAWIFAAAAHHVLVLRGHAATNAKR